MRVQRELALIRGRASSKRNLFVSLETVCYDRLQRVGLDYRTERLDVGAMVMVDSDYVDQ